MTATILRAHTLRSKGGLLRALVSDCQACAAYDSTSVPIDKRPPMQAFPGLWDTGATNTVITQRVVDACGLKPTGMKQVHTVGGTVNAETFLVNIGLPNKITFDNIEVTLGNVTGAEMLIGMDLITKGDLSITNQNGLTVFSFRTPSAYTVDFVQQLKLPQHGPGKHKKPKKVRPPKFFKKR